MCGVPFHSASGYIQKLVDNGHRVAIVEQLSEPGKKGIVERGVVQIITPGTIFDESLTNNKNNYIAALEEFDFNYTLAFVIFLQVNFVSSILIKMRSFY